jgi:hypothetical protein
MYVFVQIREFAAHWKTLTFNCFDLCVTSLNERRLLTNERDCIDNCASKLHNTHLRLRIAADQLASEKRLVCVCEFVVVDTIHIQFRRENKRNNSRRE